MDRARWDFEAAPQLRRWVLALEFAGPWWRNYLVLACRRHRGRTPRLFSLTVCLLWDDSGTTRAERH
jgi:hypothetical protein